MTLLSRCENAVQTLTHLYKDSGLPIDDFWRWLLFCFNAQSNNFASIKTTPVINHLHLGVLILLVLVVLV